MISEDQKLAELRNKSRMAKGKTIEERKVLETRGRKSVDGRRGRAKKSIVTVQLNLRVPEDLKERIDAGARGMGVTMAEFVAEAVMRFDNKGSS
jgi:predicted HicB family RNase H-like nuclease